MSSGWYLVNAGDRHVRVAVAEDRHATWVFFDGNVWRLERQPSAPSRTSRREASVMAPMPATVVAINIAPGQSVKDGDTLIVLEAMKMELPIRAPRSGIVKAVHCTKGELVQPGVNLLEIE